MFFEAHLEFVRGREGCGHTIVYEADTPEQAIDDAYRWAANRIKTLPDVFGFLGACKVSPYPIGKVQPDGYLRTGCAMWFHEWKYDWYPAGVKGMGNTCL